MQTRPRPTLYGKAVLLRPLGPEDAEAMFASLADVETMRLTGTQASYTLEQVQAHCASLETQEDRVDLAIVEPTSGAYLGEVVLNEIDLHNRSAHFRIALARSDLMGKGYGRDAARTMLAWAFDFLKLHRVQLEVFAFNERAIHVYETLGFQREGMLRETLLQDGVWHDAIVMSLLGGELLRAERPGPR